MGFLSDWRPTLRCGAVTAVNASAGAAVSAAGDALRGFDADRRVARPTVAWNPLGMGMDEAALLAWFGSELADDRLLILAILKGAGRLAIDEIAGRLALDLATVKLAVETLVLAELVTPVDGGACYRAGGPNFDDLIEGLGGTEPPRARS
ncbi:MAG: hypothetical protein J0J01_14260 [Reyranella sp.]|uniref:hypothetical protein n=1 Tax=Reyranella sp. TaxID=1929291 RepID=UPI001AD36B8C|nr:hypothetical protein [Reyranella sp.]MBN9088069.1 hypothetical protein [Reyranella sp.]